MIEHTVPKAISALVLQVMRMRRHLESEVAEVRAEINGSQRDIRERGDVLALAINLALGDDEGAALLVDIAERAAVKLRRRLDIVELQGRTWAQAKVSVP